MRSCALLFIACLLNQICGGQTQDAERVWDELVANLRSVTMVTGNAVGASAQPGEFFLLSTRMIETGGEADFRELLADKKPVFRCMGLLALAQTQGKESIPTLKTKLADQEQIEYLPTGCWVDHQTVGDFARELLRDANHLNYRKSPRPLLSDRELIGVDLEILAKPPMVWHSPSSVALRKAIEASAEAPELSFFQNLSPSLASYEIVKVVGRVRFSKPQRNFLITCLRDEALDAQTRLAAASALTRHTNDVSSLALHAQRDALNGLGHARPGDQLLETMKLRQQYSKDMMSARPSWPWKEIDPTKYEAAIAAAGHHPLGLDDLLSALGPSPVKPSPILSRAYAKTVLEISRNVASHRQPWNTYSDSASKLALLIEHNRIMESRGTLTEDACRQIEQNIKDIVQKR